MVQEIITTAIEQLKTSVKEQHELSAVCQQQVNNLRQNYRSFEGFAKKFNPQTQVLFARDERKTIMADYSTLEVLDIAFGENNSSKWITVAITDLNIFCGSKSMSDDQIADIAILIANEYRNLKFSILQLFFYRFKCGYFGKFYGKVDPMVITCALKEFIDECSKKRDNYLAEEYEARQLEDREFQKDVYRCWNNLFQELLEIVVDKHKVILKSIYTERLFIEEKCLLICVTKLQYKLLTDDYQQLYITLIKKHFSELRNVDFKYRISPTSSEDIEDKTKKDNKFE